MNILSWIFSAVIILSVILIGNKNRWGWMVANIGAIGFIYLYVKTGLWGGIALDLFLLIMNTINFRKWSLYDRVHRDPYSKPFYLKMSPGHGFKVNDVIIADKSNRRLLILESHVKDKKWKKFFRNLGMTKFLLFFGINVYDHSGCMKVKPQPK
jgi:hypothetical protein